jgi:hypothetical protein
MTPTAAATTRISAGQCLAATTGIKERQLAGRLSAFAFIASDCLVGITHGAYQLKGVTAIPAFIFIDRHPAPLRGRIIKLS